MRILRSVIANCLNGSNAKICRTFSTNFELRNKQGNTEQVFSIEPEYQSDPTLNPTQHQKLLDTPNFQHGQKFLRVGILGIPNAGKSTLINQLVGGNACPHSKKHHTTRYDTFYSQEQSMTSYLCSRFASDAILNEDDIQVVFSDTPGVVKPSDVKKFALESTIVKHPIASTKSADLLVVLQGIY